MPCLFLLDVLDFGYAFNALLEVTGEYFVYCCPHINKAASSVKTHQLAVSHSLE